MNDIQYKIWKSAYDDGYAARINEIDYSNNPHLYFKNTNSLSTAWQAGYNTADNDCVEAKKLRCL